LNESSTKPLACQYHIDMLGNGICNLADIIFPHSSLASVLEGAAVSRH